MSAPGTTERTDISEGTSSAREAWIVVVYDNDKNTFDEVVDILMRATGCGVEEAQIETWEVDQLGKSVVHQAGETECRHAASIIAEIGIRVEVAQE